jgi:hypothetical protein
MWWYYIEYEKQTETEFGVRWLHPGGISGLAVAPGTKAREIVRHGTAGGIAHI